MKKNWFFALLIIGMIMVFVKRYQYLPTYIVSNPDSQISFSVEDGTFVQTWQPTVKIIAGIQIPYYAENDFSCDMQLKIFSGDYSKVLIEKELDNLQFSAGEAGNIDFQFDRINIIPGERYRIQIAILNSAEDGLLKIASGSNYGGGNIGGKDIGQAFALTVIFVKYSKLFWVVAVLFPLLSCTLFVMVITGKKWEEIVAFPLFLEGIILFLFGVWGHLLLGVNVVYILAVTELLIAIFIFNKKNLNLKELLSPGLIIYFIFFLIIILCSNGEWLGKRDDLRHWGAAVRDMFYYDSLAKHVNTTVLLPRYLPFTALIEYLFVFMNGIFSEDILLIAYQTMILSTLAILYRPLQKKGGMKQIIPAIVATVCILVIFFPEVSSSIMVDPLQAAIVAYILICYYSDNISYINAGRIVCALIALTLIKDIGLVLAGMTLLIMFGDTVIMQIRKREIRLKKILFPILCGCLVLTLYFGWQFYMTIPAKSIEEQSAPIMHVPEDTGEDSASLQENAVALADTESVVVSADAESTVISTDTAITASGITLGKIIQILRGEGEGYQYQVSRMFVTELFDGKMFSIAAADFSFFDLLLIIFFLVVSLGYFGYWGSEKERMYTFSVLACLAGICLCIFLQVTYWFTFSKAEALKLESLERYLAPFLCAVVMVVFYLIYDKVQESQLDRKIAQYTVIMISFILVISMPVKSIVVKSTDVEENATEEMVYGHDRIAEILRSVAKKGEKVQFVCSKSDGYSEYIFRNAVAPLISDHAYWDIVGSQEIFNEQYESYTKEYGKDYFADILSAEGLKGRLKGFQYLVLFHVDEAFIESYSDLFGSAIEDGSVYSVINDNGDVSFQLIGKTGIKRWR